MNDIKNVCVYSASSTKIAKVYFDVAEELGRLLAEKKINLINGAGCIGLMAATSDAALAAGGTVTGVIPHFMVEQGWHHTGLTRLIETETMHERKRMMADLSDGVIALPGGCGTLEELLEIITWKQLGLYLNPIIILNSSVFFNFINCPQTIFNNEERNLIASVQIIESIPKTIRINCPTPFTFF